MSTRRRIRMIRRGGSNRRPNAHGIKRRERRFSATPRPPTPNGNDWRQQLMSWREKFICRPQPSWRLPPRTVTQ
jgi:hypothetical protein